MNFGSPNWLWFLWLLAPLLALLIWSWRVKQRLLTRFVSPRLLETLISGVSKQRQKIRLALFVTAAALLIFSLARPRLGFSLEESKQSGLDIVIAIDTSKSMLADDVQPNRLQRAKLAALDLMRLAQSDRLGLVAFAGSAFLQCPLSLDEDAFRQSIEFLDVNIIPQGGTALAEAITAARSAFKEETENHKVLVLFTDGEDNDDQEEARSAAREARKAGLRIFTIGVGTPKGEVLSTKDPYGNRVFIKDSQGNVVKSRLNEPLLQEVAKETDGFYLPLTGARTMEVLYERGLAPLPKSEFSTRTIRQYHERFQWFIGAAILLLLFEMLFPERKRTLAAAAPAPAHRNVDGQKALTLLALLLIPAGLFASTRDPLKEYQFGNYTAALAAYESLLAKSPGDPRLHFNAGSAAFQTGEFNVASNHFSAALTNAPLDLQQSAYYNLGNVQFRLGEAVEDWDARLRRLEESARSYRNAIALRSNDADASFNLQVVQQRLAELRERIRLREEDRLAKMESERQARQGRFRPALNIMQDRKQKNPDNKEFDDYIQRLSELNEIANPGKP
jgi:Ca-activated chloride channel homolog